MKQFISAGILATASSLSIAQLTEAKILEIEAYASIADTRSKSLLGWNNPLPKFSPL
jgi:3-methyladenine DNA glycosylase Mpg